MSRIACVGYIFLKGYILKFIKEMFQVCGTGLRTSIYERPVI
jgi:hypothetical protein